jgi:Domain of unknown function (DUF1707)
VSLEPEYERLHRKMHAQLREIYRKNGGLPISEEEFRACQERKECVILLSQGMTWIPPEPVHYDTNGYEYGKKAVMKCGPTPKGEAWTLQQSLDDAIARALKGEPAGIKVWDYTGEALVVIPPRKQEIEPPDGVHVLDRPRVGDETRGTYLERLREAYGGGYLSSDEMDARQDQILKAETCDQLNRLVKDLPPFSPAEKKEKPLPEKKKERAWTGPNVIVPAIATLYGCYYSVIDGIHGSFSGLAVSLITTGLFVFLLCIGVAMGKSPGSS